MSPKLSVLALLLAVFTLAAACGSDEPTAVETADSTDPTLSQPADGQSSDPAEDEEPQPADEAIDPDNLPEGPMPVEPDGGIGDGAGPLPGAEEPEPDNTWHGAVVAETNCPGMDFKRVEASAFSFSVPVDFVDTEAQGIDSEVGRWSNGESTIEVAYDYGWYSGDISSTAGAEVTDVDYGGITGTQAVIREGETASETNMVGIYFGEVAQDGGEWNKLGLVVTHQDPADEIIGRCIVGSIAWT